MSVARRQHHERTAGDRHCQPRSLGHWRNRMIPRMVRTLGVKTPPNVPNPALRRTSRLPVGGCFSATVSLYYIDRSTIM